MTAAPLRIARCAELEPELCEALVVLSAESVKQANERAGLPYERIVEAEFVTADELN